MPGRMYPSSVMLITGSWLSSAGPGSAAGTGELGGDRGGQQGHVGADAHERPALPQPPRRGGAVVHQQAAGLAVPLAGRLDLVDGLDEGRRREVAGHAEVVAEIP